MPADWWDQSKNRVPLEGVCVVTREPWEGSLVATHVPCGPFCHGLFLSLMSVVLISVPEIMELFPHFSAGDNCGPGKLSHLPRVR